MGYGSQKFTGLLSDQDRLAATFLRVRRWDFQPVSAMKSPATRQRRNRTTTATTVEAAQATRPVLPEAYHDLTKSWWQVIWDSPISAEWVDADVPGLVALAQLVEDFWRAEPGDRAKRHAEVRMASREYGLSPFSRRQLQWEVKRVEGTKPVAPADTPSRARDPRLRALA